MAWPRFCRRRPGPGPGLIPSGGHRGSVGLATPPPPAGNASRGLRGCRDDLPVARPHTHLPVAGAAGHWHMALAGLNFAPAVARSLRARRDPRRRDRASQCPDLTDGVSDSEALSRPPPLSGSRLRRADLRASGCAETRGRRFVTIWLNVKSRGRRTDSHYDKGELPQCDFTGHPPQTSLASAPAGARSLSGHPLPSSSAAAPRSSPQRETRPYRCVHTRTLQGVSPFFLCAGGRGGHYRRGKETN